MYTFESRVPKELRARIETHKYKSLAPEEKKKFLCGRFIIPADWPECPKIAGVQSVPRVRRYCWEALKDVETAEVDASGRGRPSSTQQKRACLARLVHDPHESLPEKWRWPLIGLATNEAKLIPKERLWLAGRRDVVPNTEARFFCTAVAGYVAKLSGFPEDAADDLVLFVRREIGGMLRMTYDMRLAIEKRLGPYVENPNSAAVVFLSIAHGGPDESIRHTLGVAARVCEAHGAKMEETSQAFCRLLAQSLLVG